jgi:hypothetical protein
MVLLLLYGCGLTDDPTARAEKVEASRSAANDAWFATNERAPVMRGIVTAYRGHDPVVETGRYDIVVTLARIWPNGCGPLHSGDYYPRLRQLLPVGTRVAAVRSQPLKVEHVDGIKPLLIEDAFVYTAGPALEADWIPSPKAAFQGETVNEQLVAAGYAEPDPMAPGLETPDEQPVMAVRSELSKLDFAYWARFASAEAASWDARVGRVADCRTARENHIKAMVRLKHQFEVDVARLHRRQLLYIRTHTYYSPSCDGDGDGICYES